MRKTQNDFYLNLAKAYAEQSTCCSRKVGAVIVRDNVPLSAGYNGAPSGVKHCADIGGCLRKKLNVPSGQRHEICRGAHAEQNAINNAAKNGININNATLYCTTYPCSMCAKSIINSGIKKIFYIEGYPDTLTEELFLSVDMEIYQIRDFI